MPQRATICSDQTDWRVKKKFKNIFFLLIRILSHRYTKTILILKIHVSFLSIIDNRAERSTHAQKAVMFVHQETKMKIVVEWYIVTVICTE